MSDRSTPEARAATLLHDELGLRSDGSLHTRLGRCLADEAGARGIDAHALVRLLRRDPAARQQLVNRMTVQETGFFRHPEHFEALAHTVLPTMPAEREPLKVWSAACANGQEAYSLAMVLEEQRRPTATVFATDVSTAAVDRTRAGAYRAGELRGLATGRRARFLEVGASGWQVRGDLRARVAVSHHNLVTDPLPAFVAECHVVFCRNVLIYLAPELATDFLRRLHEALPPGAWLFVGATETLWQTTDRFEPTRIDGGFAYRRRELRPAPPRPPAVPDVDVAPDPAATRPCPRPPRAEVEIGVAPRPVETTDGEELANSGHAAVAAGEQAVAVEWFRKWTFVAPHEPLAHVHLGFAFEATGDRVAAARAYRAALAALDRAGPDGTASVEAELDGFHPDELVKLLTHKLEAAPC